MRLILYSVLLTLMMVSSVMAFSYGGDLSLTFEGKAKETICKSWNIYSDQNLSITNKWSSNLNRWNVRDMIYSPGHKSLIVSHPNTYLAYSKGHYQVCIKASNKGEYRGILFLDYVQSGNQKIRMGIWLKAIIK